MPDYSYTRIATLKDLPLDESCVVIADEALPSCFLAPFPEALRVEAGEGLKSLSSIETLAEQVLKRRSTRPMTLVCIGGGTLGDAVGFLASILWRGVGFVQVPTTLLAMIDSAHGGKTAVNLGTMKNQLGTFHPAKNVYIVEEVLAALPWHLRRGGFAELLKVLLLADAPAVRALTAKTVEACVFAPCAEAASTLEALIEQAIRIKLDFVRRDPFETKGVRTFLNLGHTMAHALELECGLSHGAAVAWGLAAACSLSKRFGLSDSEYNHARSLLYPLLTPLPRNLDRDRLSAALQGDKKRSYGKVRSVLLHAIGDPVITNDVAEADWIDAVVYASAQLQDAPVQVSYPRPYRTQIDIDVSKSELNRALVIAALRKGETFVTGKSNAQDVAHLLSALRSLGCIIEEKNDGYLISTDFFHEKEMLERDIAVDCGDGGTTFRFLLALACLRSGITTLQTSRQLFSRPHMALVHALSSAGARIERFEEGSVCGYRVYGWNTFPSSFEIDASESSQFASALALLSMTAPKPFSIRLKGSPVSREYVEMTLHLLRDAGVELLRDRDLLVFNPPMSSEAKLELRVSTDASSVAVWKAAQFMGSPVRITADAATDSQPDSKIDFFLAALQSTSGIEEIVFDLSDTPDLLPVLAIAALFRNLDLRCTGIGHVRFKESNRLDDFAASLRSVGADCEARENEILVRASRLLLLSGRIFETHGDHRLVMAGALLAMLCGTVQVTDPYSVEKSYPAFWDDARRAGFHLTGI